MISLQARCLRFLVTLVVFASVVSACEPAATPIEPIAPTAPPPGIGGTFRFAQSSDAVLLDPWNVADENSFQITEQIFEPLVSHDASGFGIAPRLATEWELSPDRTQWTFVLRDGVTFHDGTELDAQAVVFNFERARSTTHPQRGNPDGERFAYYRRLWGGFDDQSVIVRVEALAKNRVRFTTRAPFGPFLQNLALPAFALVSPGSIRADPDRFATPASAGAAGTGPFLFEPGRWQKDVQITLDRNPAYWGKESGQTLPYLDAVVIRSISDAQTRLSELKAGTIDATRDLVPTQITAVRSDPNLEVIQRASFNVAYLGINQAVRPFDRVEVRRAVAMAINKRAIADTIYAGSARPASQFLPPRVGVVGYDDALTEFHPYNVQEARRLLQQAGVPAFTVELYYMPVSRPYYPDPRRVAEAYAADLARVGITARLNTIDWGTYRERARDNAFALWLFGWVGENGDADSWLCTFFCPLVADGRDRPTPAGNWSSPTAWQLLRDARRETDEARRAELYKQVSRIVQADVPRIPMFHVDPLTAASRSVRGYIPHPRGSEAFATVRVIR